MAGFGYGGFGTPFGGNMQQTFEQERVGFGPQGYGIYEQEMQVNRNPLTGATSIVRENEFIPMGGAGGFMGYGGYGGYGAGYGNRFY